MRLRRIAAVCVVMILVVSMLSITAFAGGHGGHGGYRRAVNTTANVSPQYSYCAVENCTIAGIHEHDGVNYYAHHSGDGHTYHTQNHYSGNHGNGYHH